MGKSQNHHYDYNLYVKILYDVCLFKFGSSFMLMAEQISTDSCVIDFRIIRKFRSKLYIKERENTGNVVISFNIKILIYFQINIILLCRTGDFSILVYICIWTQFKNMLMMLTICQFSCL